jgi:hypothetical protein
MISSTPDHNRHYPAKVQAISPNLKHLYELLYGKTLLSENTTKK